MIYRSIRLLLILVLLVLLPASTTKLNLGEQTTGILPIANGGNGTSSPALTSGANVSISGSWAGYTINASTSSSPSTITGISPSGYVMTDGTNYFIESPFYQLTPPSPNPFTGWLNQGTATEEAIGTSLVMYNASGSGVNLRTVAMGGNTTATAVLIPVLFGFGTGVNPNACIFFREASSHHVLAFTVGYNNSNSVTVGTWYMTSDGTGFGAVLTSPAIGSWPNPLHYVLLQIKVSGSNVLGYASVDGGLSWNNYFAEAKTAHFTTGPDTWGYCYVNSGSAVTSYSVLASWSVQ